MTTRGDSTWRIEARSGTAAQLHVQWPPLEWMHERVVAFSNVSHAAIVLGSSQSLKVSRYIESNGGGWDNFSGCEDRGIEVVSRSTGGGAVYVAPADQLWVDFWLPKSDVLFDHDILRSSFWVGSIWVKALKNFGLQDIKMHEGRLMPGEWGSLVCFASTGPGEVFCGTRKVVGISQRRTRHGIWFQTMLPLRWAPGEWIPCMTPYFKLFREGELLSTVELQAWLVEHVVSFDDLTWSQCSASGLNCSDSSGGSAVRAIVDGLIANLPT